MDQSIVYTKQTASENQPGQPSSNQTPGTKKPFFMFLGAIAMVVVILGGIGGYFASHSSSQKNEASQTNSAQNSTGQEQTVASNQAAPNQPDSQSSQTSQSNSSGTAKQSSNATIVGTPGTINIMAPTTASLGSDITATVILNAPQTVNTIQAKITYDPNKLTFTSTDTKTSSFAMKIDESQNSGVVTVTRASTSPLSGNLTVASLHFTAKAAGTAQISFTGTPEADRATPPNSNIISSVKGTTVTIQ